MSKYCWLLLLVVILLAAGCGNDKDAATVAPTLDSNLSTRTPRPPATAFPPTWTPPPTVTLPAARPTLEITRDRPTATMLILPSYTPTVKPPTPTPPGPTLTVTVEMLNQSLYTALVNGSGGWYEVPPTIALQDGLVLISFNLLNAPGDISSAMPIQIEASPYIVDGRLEVVKLRAYRTDTNASTENEVIDNMLMTIEEELTKLVEQLYQSSQPERADFFISDVLVTGTGIEIQTAGMARQSDE